MTPKQAVIRAYPEAFSHCWRYTNHGDGRRWQIFSPSRWATDPWTLGYGDTAQKAWFDAWVTMPDHLKRKARKDKP